MLSLRAIELKWLCHLNAVSRVAADVILAHAGLGNLQRFFDPLFSEVQEVEFSLSPHCLRIIQDVLNFDLPPFGN